MAIRYDRKLNQEINRVIRNYNAKIRRIEKYYDSFNYQIPKTITKKDLKQVVYTRNELRRKLNELKRYSQRGMELSMQTKGGYVLSRFEYENLKRERTRVNRNLTREIHLMEKENPTVYGKKQATTFAQMGDPYYLTLKALRSHFYRNIENIPKEEFERYKKLIYKTGRKQEYETSLFRENYKKMLFDLAYYTGYDKQKIDLLDKKLDKLSNRKFYKLFYTEKSLKPILEYYIGIVSEKIDPEIIKQDIWQNYDNLIENIDDIIGLL